jgi:hypothetical protein
MKTNDVKGTFLPGEVGVGIELGRPGVGAYFRDVELVGMALMKANLGYQMAAENPVTQFMTDKNTGKLRDDILNEKATSAIIEGKCKLERLPEVIKVLKDVAKTLDTVGLVGERVSDSVVDALAREQRARAETLLNQIAEHAKREGVAFTALIEAGDPSDICRHIIETHDVQCAVLVAEKRSWLTRLLSRAAAVRLPAGAGCEVKVMED